MQLMKYALRVYNANERFYGMYINISIFTAVNLHLVLENVSRSVSSNSLPTPHLGKSIAIYVTTHRFDKV